MAHVVFVAMADIAYDARTINMADALADAGYAVSLVSGGELPPRLQGRVQHYRWHDSGGRTLWRWLGFRRFVRSLHTTLQHNGHVRAVLPMDFFSLHAALALARPTKAKVIYDMREFNFAWGPLQGQGLRQRAVERMERRALRGVHRVVVSAPLDAGVVHQHYGMQRMPDVVLNTPHYAEAVTNSPLKEACGLASSQTLVLYQGVVHHGRGIRPMLDALVPLAEVHLAVLGEGPARAALEDYARSIGVQQRVHWLGMKPYDELHAWTCGADVGLCLIEPVSLSYEYALPNKYFEYMMARLPVLVTDLPALHDMVIRHPTGMLVDRQLGTHHIVNAMERLMIPATRQAMVEQCEVIRRYSYETQANIIGNVVYEVLR